MLCQLLMWERLVAFFTNDCSVDTLVDMVGQFTYCPFPVAIIVDICTPCLKLRNCSLGINVGEEVTRGYGFVVDGTEIR